MPTGVAEAKQGFWLGLGIMAAFIVLGIGQMYIMKAVSSRRGG